MNQTMTAFGLLLEPTLFQILSFKQSSPNFMPGRSATDLAKLINWGGASAAVKLLMSIRPAIWRHSLVEDQ